MRTHRGTLVAATLVVVLAGCAAPVTKVESGERGLGERMLVSLDGPWNKVSAAHGSSGALGHRVACRGPPAELHRDHERADEIRASDMRPHRSLRLPRA